MKIYLRYINPVISVMIFLLCLWAATYEDSRFNDNAIIEGGISTYFFAKGLFCGSSLYILGKMLELMLERNGKGN